MKNILLNPYCYLMIFSALLAALSQILLKKSANKKHKNRITEFLNPWVIIGYVILLSTMFINIYAYKGLDYKIGPILNSTTYIFVIILSHFILKENINKKMFIGIFLIIAGVVIFNL